MSSRPGRSRPFEYKWLAMLTASIGTFMATLDASIVNVSLPTIMRSLHADLPMVQWVVSIYLLVITGLLLSLGRLSDLVGRRRVFIAGLAVFSAGSLLCGLSGTVSLLIFFRGVQAVGAAMIMANSPAIVTQAFPSSERGKALGMIGMVVATGLTAGPALGGFLIAASGWPLIFLINVPIGAIGIWVAYVVLPRERRGMERHFDIPGAVMLLVSLVSLTLALNQGSERGWDSTYVRMLFASFVMFGLFFLWRERTCEHPIIELGLFRNRTFAAASMSAFISFAAGFAVSFLMPFYLSRILGYTPRQMGLTLAAVPLTVMVIAPISGSLSDRIGSRALSSTGLAVLSIGLLLISRLGADPESSAVVFSLVVVGLGSAIFQSPNNSSIMGSVPPNMLGVAAGMTATMRNLGMITGLAVSGAVYTSRRLFYAGEFGATQASVHAFHDAFVVAAAICAVGVITSAVRGSAHTGSSQDDMPDAE